VAVNGQTAAAAVLAPPPPNPPHHPGSGDAFEKFKVVEIHRLGINQTGYWSLLASQFEGRCKFGNSSTGCTNTRCKPTLDVNLHSDRTKTNRVSASNEHAMWMCEQVTVKSDGATAAGSKLSADKANGTYATCWPDKLIRAAAQTMINHKYVMNFKRNRPIWHSRAAVVIAGRNRSYEATQFVFSGFHVNAIFATADSSTLECGTDRLSRNVGNYQYTLRNIPEEQRSQDRISSEITDCLTFCEDEPCLDIS
jgi:hypothetical protein